MYILLVVPALEKSFGQFPLSVQTNSLLTLVLHLECDTADDKQQMRRSRHHERTQTADNNTILYDEGSYKAA